MSDLQSLISALDELDVLHDERVAAAFRAVPRHLFLPSIDPERVYTDVSIYTTKDAQSEYVGGSDQPSQLARILTAAQLEPGQNVLEIGTGAGYSAALLQHIVGKDGNVTTLELDRATHQNAQDYLRRAGAAQVKVVNVDAAGGYDPRASYDRIISTVAVWDIPSAWIRQLRPGGLIVAPIYLDGLQVAGAFSVQPDGTLESTHNITCSFVRIQGTEQPPAQYLHLGGGSALRLYSNNAHRVDSASLHMLLSLDAERCHLGSAPGIYDYWYGFIPYAMLNRSDDYQFVCYTVEGDKMVYGLRGSGFGLISQGSASFVCADELGDTNCFAGVDAFLQVVDLYDAWTQAGKPRIEQLYMQLIPSDSDSDPTPSEHGRLFPRRDHNLHAWLAPTTE